MRGREKPGDNTCPAAGLLNRGRTTLTDKLQRLHVAGAADSSATSAA